MKSKPDTLDDTPAQAAAQEPEPDTSDIPETDFRNAQRNPYVVILAPDVRKRFPTSEAVNAALRDYARSRQAARK